MIGHTLAQGRYEIREKLGEGGAAFVFRAYDRALARDVAIKVLRPELASDAEFVERFRREAHAAAALSHPNIASIFDIGAENGNHFFVMEYIPGGTLKDRLEEKGRIPPAEALDITAAVCSALQSAHEHGIVHRDIKPRNIMFTRDGHVKVADFGIARALAAASISQTGTIIGSVHYISPEQAAGDEVGPQSDIYSLGIVLFEMLTGKVPYDADTPVAVALRHIHEPIPSLRLVQPGLPSSFDRLIEGAMAKQPADRYPSAQVMREQVEKLRDAITRAEPIPAVSRGADDATRVIPRPSAASPYISPGGAVVRRRAVQEAVVEPEPTFSPATWAVVIIAVVIALIGIAFLIYRGNAPAPPVATPAPPQSVTVPNLVGMPLVAARRQLADLGVTGVRTEDEETDLYDPGTVIRQYPPPGSALSPTEFLTLTVAKKKEETTKPQVEVPDVQGLSQEAAVVVLIENGFDHAIIQEASDTVKEGCVVRQFPSPGSQRDEGSSVTLVVSTGPSAPSPPPPERPTPAPFPGPEKPQPPEELPLPPAPEEGPDAGSHLAPTTKAPAKATKTPAPHPESDNNHTPSP